MDAKKETAAGRNVKSKPKYKKIDELYGEGDTLFSCLLGVAAFQRRR